MDHLTTKAAVRSSKKKDQKQFYEIKSSCRMMLEVVSQKENNLEHLMLMVTQTQETVFASFLYFFFIFIFANISNDITYIYIYIK